MDMKVRPWSGSIVPVAAELFIAEYTARRIIVIYNNEQIHQRTENIRRTVVEVENV